MAESFLDQTLVEGEAQTGSDSQNRHFHGHCIFIGLVRANFSIGTSRVIDNMNHVVSLG